MITTRRQEGYSATDNSVGGGVDLLEKEVAYETATPAREESMEEAKARMQRNLDRLLNYDRYSEMEAEEQAAVIEDTPQEEIKAAYSDEDIRPTTTTTQFIDGDPQIFNDAEKSRTESKSSYKLNGKGKLIVAMYALVVTVILALIVLNTGVLKSLAQDISALDATYTARVSELNAQNAEITRLSSDERVVSVAVNEYNMVYGN